jgi:SAM-dependent methyltransferase
VFSTATNPLDFKSERRAIENISMENGVEMYKDKPLKTRFPQNLVFLVVMVVLNVVALLTFSNYYPHGVSLPASADGGHSFDKHLSMLLNSSQRDAQDTLLELFKMREDLKTLREQAQHISAQIAEIVKGTPMKEKVTKALSQLDGVDPANPWLAWAKGDMPKGELGEYTAVRKLPLGFNPALNSDSIISSIGHGCALLKSDLEKFMDYTVGGECPDDEPLAQKLLLGGCEPLPRRRCFARKPEKYTEPVPFPESLWTLPDDNNFLWTAHPCKSFECLNERAKKKVFADCLDCFDLDGREKHRWVDNAGSLDFTIDEVVHMKPRGTLKIGLDIGGGTGSFAARMREYNVTIVTSTLNLNGPFNNFIAHRGLVPLFLTVSQRLPFADNTLDVVHSMHVLSNWIPNENLEFILFDIDRVLRPGGFFWLDHFFCVEKELATFVPMIEQLGYIKHKWNIGEKLDRGAELQERYISGLLEKPKGPL